MLVLGIDSSLDACSLAIAQENEIIYSESVPCRNSHAEVLPNMVQAAFIKSSILANQLTKIAVTCGPGSFNGLRVGLAFAKGLGLALEIPVVGISTLMAMKSPNETQKIINIISQSSSIYAAAYDGELEMLAPTAETDFAFLNEFDKNWEIRFLGSMLDAQMFEESKLTICENIDPKSVALWGSYLNADENPAKPLYLRGAGAVLWQGSQYV